MSAAIILEKDREKSLLRKHPWVFSKAVKKVVGKPGLGELVDIIAADGTWLAKGSYSPESQIRARVWSYDREETIDTEFFIRRIRRALACREEVIARGALTGFRLVAAESDGLPGVTIDKFDRYLVCQLLSAGAEYYRVNIIAALQELFPEHVIYDRSDVDVRKKEGLAPVKGPLIGELPDMPVVISENGIQLQVDIKNGHKTGFYLDQRDNRAIAARYAAGKSVLNCFSYTCTFSVYAAKAGATRVVNVDVSGPALEIGKANLALNGLADAPVEFVQEDVFKLLRQYRQDGVKFDMIILDPPKFAESKAQLVGACRGYKDINMIAMQLLNPGGILLTFSCSGLMEDGLFQKVVADAALDAKRDVVFLEKMQQAADHLIASYYPEGFYLKGLVAKVY